MPPRPFSTSSNDKIKDFLSKGDDDTACQGQKAVCSLRRVVTLEGNTDLHNTPTKQDKTYGSDMAAITACGPTCLSMVAYYFTGDQAMSPDKIMDFAVKEGYCVKGKGTAWALIGEGAEKLGLNSKELPLSEGVIRRELAKGNPVICVMGPGVFTTTGHFIVLTGYENGQFRVNDPNSLRRSQKLWSYSEFYDQIRNLWAISAPTTAEGSDHGEGQ